ncbi:unnamed protein product [Cuscuta epithymum]|uniref:Uncharacterized protein n=1 Tax=Cuscuta epithymum TaxID=186058 RepID=A0AAV0DDP4_9ASTE|nr:unnamed protein product [Cuscuta epithymum]
MECFSRLMGNKTSRLDFNYHPKFSKLGISLISSYFNMHLMVLGSAFDGFLSFKVSQISILAQVMFTGRWFEFCFVWSQNQEIRVRYRRLRSNRDELMSIRE